LRPGGRSRGAPESSRSRRPCATIIDAAEFL
jgi:hypothetical protein